MNWRGFPGILASEVRRMAYEWLPHFYLCRTGEQPLGLVFSAKTEIGITRLFRSKDQSL